MKNTITPIPGTTLNIEPYIVECIDEGGYCPYCGAPVFEGDTAYMAIDRETSYVIEAAYCSVDCALSDMA